MKRRLGLPAFLFLALLAPNARPQSDVDALRAGFIDPPATARPWVYWFFMDGNLSREGMTADLRAMAAAGIGGVIVMEVDVGIPRGPVRFMSKEWRELFKHAATEADRLGLEIDLNASPGWTGSGGPWIEPAQSMQKLVCSETRVAGPRSFDGVLPEPERREGFYRDVAVLAFPAPAAPAAAARIAEIEEKALYRRGHFSSEAGVRTSIPMPAQRGEPDAAAVVPRGAIIDLSARLAPDGRLAWEVPAGEWNVLRFGHTSTGANTRPAPAPGLGLECDKLDKGALEAHFAEFIGKLMADIGPLTGRSLTSLHIDSWEMGPQNWTAAFPEEFVRRRGYDPVPFLPAMTGRVVESLAVSERFLWDLRLTVQELIIENYAEHLGALARGHGLRLSIQPYDGTPCDDLAYGSAADVPMCEFWANCFETYFSVFEAASIAHTCGRAVVAAEAFTSDSRERWLLHPGVMKALGDWAFCSGVNRFVFHRYAHQPWIDRWPGMTMGPFGIHYERTQTWWELVPAYHDYLARCQFMLQQGAAVADICVLTPECGPHAFRPPASYTTGTPPDHGAFDFDACTPAALLDRAAVADGRIVFQGGTSYRVLVLPDEETMTPRVLNKVRKLVAAGATVIGPRPVASPSLAGYPQCDREVAALAAEVWGACDGAAVTENRVGKGRVVFDAAAARAGRPAPPPRDNPLSQCRWIWHSEGNPAAAAPVGPRYFRHTFALDPGVAIEAARVVLTADNAFELFVNGDKVGEGDDFTRAYDFDVAALLRPGKNVLAVRAENGGDRPNPAGLIAAVEVLCRDGRVLRASTGEGWESAASAEEGWSVPGASAGAPWAAALELGRYGVAPWGEVGKPPPPVVEYPAYGAVAAVLAGMGVAPDFEADCGLRYTHRRLGSADIYFVANPRPQEIEAEAVFRAAGAHCELWWPDTGLVERAAASEMKDGRTRVRLHLDPHGSVFVLFHEEAGGAPAAAAAAPGRAAADAVATATGPWEVRFQAGRGAPESATFSELIDWSAHPDPGVRHFSGLATYTTTVQLPADALAGVGPLVLDLGRVAVMARVRLNGHDLGVLWKPPFRVPAGDSMRAGANTLEITVANLWPNRLIGDQSLPPEERIARTTWNPFAADTPLLESGLLGPVRVVGTVRR